MCDFLHREQSTDWPYQRHENYQYHQWSFPMSRTMMLILDIVITFTHAHRARFPTLGDTDSTQLNSTIDSLKVKLHTCNFCFYVYPNLLSTLVEVFYCIFVILITIVARKRKENEKSSPDWTTSTYVVQRIKEFCRLKHCMIHDSDKGARWSALVRKKLFNLLPR